MHRPAPRSASELRSEASKIASPRERFLHADRYRVDREWNRYEGTPQRDLFRSLRERILRAHRAPEGWTLEIGPGPGRFSSIVGGDRARRVLLDLSTQMLRSARERWATLPGSERGPSDLDLIQGDGAAPPVREHAFAEVVALGNVVGFAGEQAEPFLDRLTRLVGDRGWLHVELSAGSGTRSRYLRRLPASTLPRVLDAPARWVTARVLREGFDALPATRAETHGFRRISPEQARAQLEAAGFTLESIQAIAPALGSEPDRLVGIRREPRAWSHLLELEEGLGREPVTLRRAAAYLVVARRSKRGQRRAPRASTASPGPAPARVPNASD